MKALSLEAILHRRKSNAVQSTLNSKQNIDLDKCISKHFRQVNDQTIQDLINTAIKGQPFSQNQKLNALEIIANKTTIALKKQEVLQRMKVCYYPGVNEMDSDLQKLRQSYFILKGRLILYQRNAQARSQSKFNTQPKYTTSDHIEQQQQKKYVTLEEFQKQNPHFQAVQEFQDFRGVGKLFNLVFASQKMCKLVAVDAVVVQFKQPDQVSEVVSDGITYDEKLELLSYFPILKSIGKKLLSLVHSFKMKHYNLKDVIYEKGEMPQSVYFVIKGEVGFQLLIENEQTKKGIPLITQTICQPCYFGEEDILFKTNRSHTAKALTSKCIMLQLDRQKFQKLLQNQQFSTLIQRAAETKQQERKRKYDKAREIAIARDQNLHAVDPKLTDHQLKSFNLHEKSQNKRRFSTLRGASKTKVLHGNLIRECRIDDSSVEFSMLRVNPDHYEATKDKFRRYNVKEYKEQPKSAWNFKKLWRILNLQDILREEEVQLGNNEGRKFFDTHRRLQYQLNESKSVRPKTTSSNYRTKMQYIAYLQQFNH